jgi:hypothetical protein
MTESEATARANAIMSVRTGADAAPASAEFKSIGGRRTWTMYYKGYIVKVNDKNGEVSVFENPPPEHTF